MIEITYKGECYLLHTAWAEHAVGPGWSNRIYWAIVSPVGGPRHGVLEKIGIQPDEQSLELQSLFEISAVVHKSVTAEMSCMLNSKK